MSESYHTSRMRETCTSGSQEGRGSDGHWPSAFQSVLLAYSTDLLFRPVVRCGLPRFHNCQTAITCNWLQQALPAPTGTMQFGFNAKTQRCKAAKDG